MDWNQAWGDKVRNSGAGLEGNLDEESGPIGRKYSFRMLFATSVAVKATANYISVKDRKWMFDPVYDATKLCLIKRQVLSVHMCSRTAHTLAALHPQQVCFQSSVVPFSFSMAHKVPVTHSYSGRASHTRTISFSSSLMSLYYMKRFGSREFSRAEMHYCIK